MSKLSCNIPAQLITLTIIGVVLMLSILVSGICATPGGLVTPPNDEGFAIYLTEQDIPPAQMEALSHVNLTDQPIISMRDVITYDGQTHEIELTEEAFERISQLDVSTGGKSFIVCVDKAPIYWGAFWVPWSCTLFDGVTIWKPLTLNELHDVIRIELSEIYMGEDPRSNPLVMESLEQAGKLVKDEGFAIYLTKQDTPPAQMEDLNRVDIAEEPIITISDIITYDAQEHELRLTASAFERVSQLDVPTSGKSFIVCVDKQPIYWGAFWVLWSSQSFDGVTIWMPLGIEGPDVIRIQLGYPSSELHAGGDPRSNPVVMESLEQAGKLITGPPMAVAELPHSVKGYELYSWEEEGQWRFTLITGTDRIKTIEEITSEQDFVYETGWVKIQVVGTDAIKDVISRLPEGESVFWCDELHIGQSTETDFQLPPGQTVDAIEEYANQCGLDFVVTVPSC